MHTFAFLFSFTISWIVLEGNSTNKVKSEKTRSWILRSMKNHIHLFLCSLNFVLNIVFKSKKYSISYLSPNIWGSSVSWSACAFSPKAANTRRCLRVSQKLLLQIYTNLKRGIMKAEQTLNQRQILCSADNCLFVFSVESKQSQRFNTGPCS